jgi:hypothetical protein
MMIILPPNIINMQRHAGALGKALQAVWNHLGTKVSYLLSFQGHVDNRIWAIGKVDNSTGESFVEGCVCITETGETCRGPECRLEGLTKRDKCVFSRMVIINCRVGGVR